MNFPILSTIVFIPLIGALFILITKGTQKNVEKNSKYVAIFISFANFLLSLFLWFSFDVTNSEFQFCTECIIEADNIDRPSIKEQLSNLGDSFILAGNKMKVKIHIHTNNPSKVFSICESFGEIKNQKADDMHAQIASSHHKKSNIAIVTDSGCDILEDPHNTNIHMIPVRYSFGDKEYIDKISQSSEEFYEELKNNPIHPKTSQPPTGDFINKFDLVIKFSLRDTLIDPIKGCLFRYSNAKILFLNHQ